MKYQELFTPVKVGSITIKNRFAMAPMGPLGLADANGGWNQRGIDYYVERAKGGAAMIMCNIAASDSLEDTSHSIFLNEESIPYFEEICRRSHEAGSLVCAQLHPGNGRIGAPSTKYKAPISASAVPCMPWTPVPTP